MAIVVVVAAGRVAAAVTATVVVGGQDRGGNVGSGGRPTCQVCKKYGHDALRCRQRFNHAYQPDDHRERTGNSAQTSSYTVDTNWYAAVPRII